MTPPFEVTPRVQRLLAQVERAVGRLEGVGGPRPQPLLRKKSRIRTVHGSVAIEGNTLSIAQVTAVVAGKRVLGLPREILEVQNANRAYEQLPGVRPWSSAALRAAHRTLMKGLLPDAGRWRAGPVGILRGHRVVHVAPPAARVGDLIGGLLRWGAVAEIPIPIIACVVHYELSFIHPFSDGNGRLARLWQQAVLARSSDVFSFVPVESLIRERQREYYAALRASDRAGHCTRFLEFSLQALGEAVEGVLSDFRPERERTPDRLSRVRAALTSRWFSRAEYLSACPERTPLSASRDLAAAVADGTLKKRGDKRFTRYRFIGK